MRILFSTCSGANYMAPPQLADEQINCGPFFRDREIGGHYVSLATPKGDYDLAAIAAKLPEDQQPDAVVCLVDASWFNTPKNLAAFKCPRIALVADTHHMTKPVTGMIQYLLSQPFDRIVFLYTRHHLEFFREAGLKNLFWYPGLTFPHGDEVVHAARREVRLDRIALIGQAGNLHQRRLKLAGALAAAGLPLVFREASQREGLEFYGESLIGFNATANADLNLRVFEIMSTGSMLLMDRLAPASGFPSLWQDGRHFVGYDNAEELVERARHFVAHPAEARAIGAAGAEWFDRHFNAAKRRADFESLVWDGRAAPEFAVTAPRNTLLSGFNGQAAPMVSALRLYEHLQKLHSTAERVTVLADDTVPSGVAAMAETLPRLRVVRKLSPGEVADCFATSTQRALALSSLDAPRLWCWDATANDLPALHARFTPAGLTHPRDDLALFEVAEPVSAVDRLAADARKLLLHCDLGKAFEFARRALQENPRSLEAYLVMAELALEGGKADLFAKMIAHARQLAADDPRIALLELAARQPELRQRPAERLLAVALRHVSGSELQAAKNVASRALALDGQLPAAWFCLGRISLALSEDLDDVAQWREFGTALKYLRTAAELGSRRFEYWLELAGALRRGGLFAEAARAFERALALDPAQPTAWLELGETLLSADRADAAAEAFERGLRHAPRSRLLTLWLGHARKRQGKLDEALLHYHSAHGVSSRDELPPPAQVIFVTPPTARPALLQRLVDSFASARSWRVVKVSGEDGRSLESVVLGRGDVVVLAGALDEPRAAAWRVPALLAAGARLVWLPLEIDPEDGRCHADFGLNSLLARTAWLAGVGASWQKRQFTDHCIVGDHHVVELPMLDSEHPRHVVTGDQRRVAWLPDADLRLDGSLFGAGRSTFLRWHEYLIAEAARRPDVEFWVWLSPQLETALEACAVMSGTAFVSYVAKWERLPNVRVSRAETPDDALARVGAVMCDAATSALVCAKSGRRVLLLRNPRGPVLADEFRRGFPSAERAQEIADFLDEVETGRWDGNDYRATVDLQTGDLAASLLHAVESRLAERCQVAEVTA